MHQVLCSATETREQMVVVGIDGRAPASHVWRNPDPALLDGEPPWLCIVAVGAKRRVAHELFEASVVLQRGPRHAHRFIVGHRGTNEGICRTQRCGARRPGTAATKARL